MADKTDVYFARQLGLVTIEQTIECGMSERTRRRRCAVGEWHASPPSGLPVARVPLLARATASCGSARRRPDGGHLALRGGELARGRAIPFGACRAERAAASERHARRLLSPSDRRPQSSTDVTMLGPIPVTTHARTLVDLGAVARPWLVRRALEQWLREGHVTVPQVRATLDRVARRGRGWSRCASRGP